MNKIIVNSFLNQIEIIEDDSEKIISVKDKFNFKDFNSELEIKQFIKSYLEKLEGFVFESIDINNIELK